MKYIISSVLLLVTLNIYGQQTISKWIPASGKWVLTDTTICQEDLSSKQARIDIRLPEKEVIKFSFTVEYIKGGYRNKDDLKNKKIHAGFGVHIGVQNPNLKKSSWGNGKSYLLWLNIDTTDWTEKNRKEYIGLRAQIYRSSSAHIMRLLRDTRIKNNNELDRMTPGDYISIDLVSAIQKLSNRFLPITKITEYAIQRGLFISIQFNKKTGKVSIADPTNPSMKFITYLDPAYLQGNYFSLRTNSIAVSFKDFKVQ